MKAAWVRRRVGGRAVDVRATTAKKREGQRGERRRRGTRQCGTQWERKGTAVGFDLTQFELDSGVTDV